MEWIFNTYNDLLVDLNNKAKGESNALQISCVTPLE